MSIYEKIKGLHVLTDRDLALPRTIPEIIRLLASSKISTVQLRDKKASSDEMISLGKKLQSILIPQNIPLIINDNLDVAIELKAAGIHVGQKDMPAKKVKNIIGDKMLLGVSVSNVYQALKAQEDGAAYLGVGPIFYTSTKQDINQIVGIKGLKEIKRNVDIPVITIGGITLENVAEIAGISDGIAVISAIIGTKDPPKTALDFLEKMKKTIINERIFKK